MPPEWDENPRLLLRKGVMRSSNLDEKGVAPAGLASLLTDDMYLVLRCSIDAPDINVLTITLPDLNDI